MTQTVAIPIYRDEVAPCFEAAQTFVMARIEGGRVVSRKIVKSTGCKGFGNLQLLREEQVTALLCNGIKAFYRDALVASKIRVVPRVSAAVEQALAAFAAGELDRTDLSKAEDDCPPVPLTDLVCWTRELFTSHGYTVHAREEADPFPIDLVAEIACPKCHKPVRIAICCGAHTYRCSQEISEFNRVAQGNYHARVYVRPGTPQIEQCCRDYGIELVDPNARFASKDHPAVDRLPILQMPVPGHEQASGAETEPEST
ncbi:hypothetical protein GF377_10120 [candidate division GN15 bacterium]|nr:hypothetical protein [candidate division GN15 bacterium]